MMVLSGAAFAAPTAAENPSDRQDEGEGSGGTIVVSLSGKVVETMNSGGYTYVCLEKAGKKTWVAVPETNSGQWAGRWRFNPEHRCPISRASPSKGPST